MLRKIFCGVQCLLIFEEMLPWDTAPKNLLHIAQRITILILNINKFIDGEPWLVNRCTYEACDYGRGEVWRTEHSLQRVAGKTFRRHDKIVPLLAFGSLSLCRTVCWNWCLHVLPFGLLLLKLFVCRSSGCMRWLLHWCNNSRYSLLTIVGSLFRFDICSLLPAVSFMARVPPAAVFQQVCWNSNVTFMCYYSVCL